MGHARPQRDDVDVGLGEAELEAAELIPAGTSSSPETVPTASRRCWLAAGAVPMTRTGRVWGVGAGNAPEPDDEAHVEAARRRR